MERYPQNRWQSLSRWVYIVTGLAMGFVVGAAVGWLEWSIHLFNGLATVLLVLSAAALGYFLRRRSRWTHQSQSLLLGLLLGLSLVFGYQVSQYVTFRKSLSDQISDQLRQQNVVPIPEAVNASIDQIIAGSSGVGGFAGYLWMKMSENGSLSAIMLLLSAALVIAAALVAANEGSRSGP